MQRRSIALMVLALAGGCSTPPATTTDVDAGGGGTDTGTPPPVDAAMSTPDTGVDPSGDVTYYEDTRPIFARHCVSCHVAGGIGPFPLDTYAAAMPMADRVAQATTDRIMPPFLADNSGDCQSFITDDWLSDAEIAVFANWAAQGAPEGDPTTPAPEVVPAEHLTGPDVHTIDMGVDYAPDMALTDDYRCFIVDAPAGGFVTGYEVHPGNSRIVHHVIAYAPQDAASVTEAQRLDDMEPGPGYTCFGSSRTDAMPIVLWAPGGGATMFPRNTGLEINGTRPIIIQVHYNLLAAEPTDTDRTTIDLRIADSAVPAFFLPIADYSFNAAPHMSSVSTTATQGLDFITSTGLSQVTIYGSFPHMHTLGTNLGVDVVRGDGAEECLIDVPRWDFNWQLPYWYETPVRVRATDSIRITCTWDTSSRDTSVSWGEGTQDEMCLNFVYVSI